MNMYTIPLQILIKEDRFFLLSGKKIAQIL